MNSRIRPTSCISLKSRLCCFSFPTVAPQQLIVQTSHSLTLTLNNSSVNVAALKRKPWKLTSLVTEIISIKFVISILPFLNLYVWITNLIDQCVGDSRKLFRVDNSLSRELLETAHTEHDDPTKLDNEFGTFSSQKNWNHKGKSLQVTSSRTSTCFCYYIHRTSV